MKKIVSLLLAMTMLLCSLPIFASAKEEERPLSKPQLEILKNNVLMFDALTVVDLGWITQFEKIYAELLPSLSNATSPEAQATTAECYGYIFDRIYRDYTKKEDEEKILAFKDKVCPPITDFNLEEVQIARLKSLPYVYSAIKANPDKVEEICNRYISFVGPTPTNPSAAVQAAAAETYTFFLYSVIGNTRSRDAIILANEKLVPKITALDSEEVQIARCKVLAEVYSQAARDPAKINELKEIIIDNLGPKPSNPSVKIQAAATESFVSLIESIARQPNSKDDLLALAKTLSPDITDKASEEVQIARCKVIEKLYALAPDYSESIDYIKNIITDKLGSKPSNPSVKVQAAVAESYGNLIETLAGKPEIKNTLLDLANTLSPDITNLSSDEVQIARCKTLEILYGQVANNPDKKELLENMFLEKLGPKPSNPSVKVQAAAAESLRTLINCLKWQKQYRNELIALSDSLSPDITDLSSDEVQIARCKVIPSLYSTISIEPEDADYVKNIFLNKLGPKPSNPSAKVQAAAAENLSKLFILHSSLMNGGEKFVHITKELSPTITNFNSEEVQLGRIKAIFDASVHRKFSNINSTFALIKEFLGGSVDLNNYKVTFKNNRKVIGTPEFIFAGSNVTKPENLTMTNAGFLGWFNGNKEFSFNTPITSDIILEAKWANCEPMATELKNVPEALKDTPFNTLDKIRDTLRKANTSKIPDTFKEKAQHTFYDVTIKIVENGVARIATEEELANMKNVTLLLPYPEGTNPTDYNFIVTHMITREIDALKPGNIETPIVKETKDGLLVTFSGLSPVCISYYKDTEKGTNSKEEIAKTADSSSTSLAIAVLGLFASLSGITILNKKEDI